MELTKADADTINWFFASIQALYGRARYASQWPTLEDEGMAKSIWGADIAKHQRWELQNMLEYAKSHMHEEGWIFPDIAKILNGNKITGGAAGAAAASHRPWRENLPDHTSQDTQKLSGPLDGLDEKTKSLYASLLEA